MLDATNLESEVISLTSQMIADGPYIVDGSIRYPILSKGTRPAISIADDLFGWVWGGWGGGLFPPEILFGIRDIFDSESLLARFPITDEKYVSMRVP